MHHFLSFLVDRERHKSQKRKRSLKYFLIFSFGLWWAQSDSVESAIQNEVGIIEHGGFDRNVTIFGASGRKYDAGYIFGTFSKLPGPILRPTAHEKTKRTFIFSFITLFVFGGDLKLNLIRRLRTGGD